MATKITQQCSYCLKVKTHHKWYHGCMCKACYMRAWRKANPTAVSAIEKRRKVSPAVRSARWRLKNPEREKYLKKQDYERNKHKYLAQNQRRRALNRLATPSWLTKEQKNQISQIYQNRPDGFHVDHIIPLRGNDVCGLNVPWNLQYLPAIDNLKKGNRFK